MVRGEKNDFVLLRIYDSLDTSAGPVRGLPRLANTMPLGSTAWRSLPAAFNASIRSGPGGICRAGPCSEEGGYLRLAFLKKSAIEPKPEPGACLRPLDQIAQAHARVPRRPDRESQFHKQLAIHDDYFGNPAAPVAGKLGAIQQLSTPPGELIKSHLPGLLGSMAVRCAVSGRLALRRRWSFSTVRACRARAKTSLAVR